MSRRIRFTLLACGISGVASGLVSTMPSSDASFLSQPLYYFPGLVFGYCFARTNLAGPLRAVLFTAGSGLIYFGAVQAFMALQSPSPFMGSLLPGLIGGLGLSLLTKLLTRGPLTMFDEGLAGCLGAVAGYIFIMLFGLQPQPLGTILAYVVWQIPVGGLLSWNLERQMAMSENTPA